MEITSHKRRRVYVTQEKKEETQRKKITKKYPRPLNNMLYRDNGTFPNTGSICYVNINNILHPACVLERGFAMAVNLFVNS